MYGNWDSDYDSYRYVTIDAMVVVAVVVVEVVVADVVVVVVRPPSVVRSIPVGRHYERYVDMYRLYI